MPVYKLLGGAFHERIPLYHNGWWRGAETTEEVIAKAHTAIAGGATRLKWYPFEFLPQLQSNFHVTTAQLERGVSEVLAMREAVGPGIELMIDVWRRLDLNSAIRFCKAIEKAGLAFVEEAVPAENTEVTIRLSNSVDVRLAAGERLLNRWDFCRLIETQALGVIQPDVPRVGGLTEARKIAALADTYGIGVAPHNPCGSVATAAAVHLCAGIRNFAMLERFVPFRPDPFVEQDLTYGPDYVELPTSPGMGVRVNEAELKRLSEA
jgi:galactonate dehydratase